MGWGRGYFKHQYTVITFRIIKQLPVDTAAFALLTRKQNGEVRSLFSVRDHQSYIATRLLSSGQLLFSQRALEQSGACLACKHPRAVNFSSSRNQLDGCLGC